MTPPTSGEGPVTPRHLLAMTPLYPPHIGGLESHAEQFNHQLASPSLRITVFTPLTKSGGALAEQSTANIKIYRYPAIEIIPNYHLPQFWSRDFRHQWQQLAATPVDLVMSRTRFFFSGILAFRYARSHHIKWLHVEHGSDFVQLNNTITNLAAKLYDYTLGKLVLRKADWVVANSQASAQFVKKLSGRSDVTVIYRGLDQLAITAITPAPHATNTITITYAGRLIDGKGVADLLTAVSQLKQKDQYQNWHLLIIGDGPQRQKLELLAKQTKLSEKVTFLGEKSWPETISYLKATDIFVNPSYTEGLPTAVIEAAACGCAIIATDVGGTPEIIVDNHSGLLLPPRAPTMIAKALQQLMVDGTKRQRLAKHAKQTVTGKFDWQHSITRYRALLQKLLPIHK